ncbi:hypothetical protein CPAST_c12740 [Clostridium pasteurianum DSM 525 = ATCC 6013]|uniref:Uncharacterized protein n=1 Tax=Clostridium pasteurianum DSM 525 = ATCC 6013 TaxID=1262449 RepID=A0A0H3J1T6_CLOPA|nr:hypothetical protein [Clostridium pasteurianum]AJA47374.1 hypothetical protein CPAST_c12740 [Clostridium pasteurianum DSM 525 = ATCC 6013]AJA51362.1 hypothetical protein CLPA_c12740 [Clostridium pasteurianum DSM 525 = ATCC 6013]KRU12631.1 hypothetical protein CP6013_01879 [Clostridium pasteurianum DSM 525 = ATCC 6013]UZW15544.1 hypothetical protein OSC52_06810 [Clostridium pasteurianum]
MKFLRWIVSLFLLLFMTSIIFKAGSNFINLVLILSGLLLALDLFLQRRRSM